MQAIEDTTVAATVDAYVECALWAGLDWSREDESGHNPPLDENYGAEDLAGETVQAITADVRDFMEANAADVSELDASQVGHDFYLSRNGHDAGFFDRGLGDVGDRLQDAARVYGTSELYVGDDGLLYLHG